MTNIRLRQLDVFVAVATEGSVSRASERLHLTQPAASMALSGLEQALGTPLFDRQHGRLHLNTQGRELLPQAREILERVRDMENHAGGAAQKLQGELRIGASNTIGNYLVGDLLGPFALQHPQVTLRLQVVNTHDITQAVLNHRLDIACVEGIVNEPRLDRLFWRHDALSLYAQPDDPLTRHSTLTPQDFADARWILREPGSAMRTLAEQAMDQLAPGRIV